MDVICYAVLGLVAATAFHHPFQIIIRQRIAPYFSGNPCVMFSLGLLLGVGVAIVLAHLGAAPRVWNNKFCIWLRYPPSWLPVILAVPGLILIQGYVLKVDYFSGLSAGEIFRSPIKCARCWGFLAGIILAIISRWLWGACRGKKSDNTTASPQVQEEMASDGGEQLTDEGILKWIKTETPIETKEDDFLDAEVYASRIVEKIRKRSFQNCALVGRYGTGKSSVLNLVKEKLLGKDFKLESSSGCSKICVCRVDGWGCVREKVPEAILKQAIHELQDSMDCLAVSRLPTRYQQALERLPSPGPVMGAIIIEPTDAATELEKLNSILDTAGVHLVILLEDIDRNGKKGEKAMGVEVPALLDRLKECDAITVIVTLGLENPNAEVLVRVCEHREDLISRIDNMVDVIRKFREGCLTKYPDDLEADSHGNVQLSGTGALADALVTKIKAYFKEQGIESSLRARGDTFGYVQRSHPDQSEVDREESLNVGRTAAREALSGTVDGSIAIQRVSDEPYEVKFMRVPLKAVAGKTRHLPDAFINEAGNNVTPAFLTWGKPLIGTLPRYGILDTSLRVPKK